MRVVRRGKDVHPAFATAGDGEQAGGHWVGRMSGDVGLPYHVSEERARPPAARRYRSMAAKKRARAERLQSPVWYTKTNERERISG